jgi:hypothetical protein
LLCFALLPFPSLPFPFLPFSFLLFFYLMITIFPAPRLASIMFHFYQPTLINKFHDKIFYNILLKYQTDIAKATKELSVDD